MADNDVETINCPIGKWYFKRMTLLGLLMLGFGAWFLYDGLVGYPKGQVKAIAYESFEVGSESSWEEYGAKADTKLSKSQLSESDMEVVKAAHAAGGQKATWADFALKKKIDTGEPAADSEHRKLYDAFQARNGGATWSDYAASNGLSRRSSGRSRTGRCGCHFQRLRGRGAKNVNGLPTPPQTIYRPTNRTFTGKGTS